MIHIIKNIQIGEIATKTTGKMKKTLPRLVDSLPWLRDPCAWLLLCWAVRMWRCQLGGDFFWPPWFCQSKTDSTFQEMVGKKKVRKNVGGMKMFVHVVPSAPSNSNPQNLRNLPNGE